MRKEFIVERQGRSFCLYAGLLDLATQQGLKSIRTEIVQLPTEENNRVAICTALVVLEREGVERTFTGIGDAAPNNVAPAMQQCLLRMAETRSKARALRDAVNIGVSAFEELGDDDAQDGAPEAPRQARSVRQPSRSEARPARQADNPNGPAATTQRDAIANLCKKHGHNPEQYCRSEVGAGLDDLSHGQAGALIQKLNRAPVAA